MSVAPSKTSVAGTREQHVPESIKAPVRLSGTSSRYPHLPLLIMSRRTSDGLRGLQRFEEFYLPGGDLYCLVQNRMFRVHRYFFERESKYFEKELATPVAPGAQRLGSTDDSAIVLNDVRSDQFAKLLWVFYNPKYSLYEASVDDWAGILELAFRWQFGEVKKLAIRELEKLEMADIDRIVLYRKFQVDESLLIMNYVALAQRTELITLEEGQRLGMEVVIALSRARECLRNTACSGSQSPSPSTVTENDVREAVLHHFSVSPSEPTESTKTPANTSTPNNSATPIPQRPATPAKINGAAGGATNGLTNGTAHASGTANGTASSTAIGTTNGTTNGTNGTTNGSANGSSNGSANGSTTGPANAANGTTNGPTSLVNGTTNATINPNSAATGPATDTASSTATKPDPPPKLDTKLDGKATGQAKPEGAEKPDSTAAKPDDNGPGAGNKTPGGAGGKSNTNGPGGKRNKGWGGAV
ncbi:unnamed protein product [Mycena citricolor]|uniref:BTB domain-containing protein n=1 Tax=Mycena citricolor TaxID=2018698 RepID=A0AAD2K6E2_9AGAR|nr:unnamed protein product [Mycena citricolor]